MDINYKVRNFRNFNNDGVEFKLSPITILTGANCAGKSTLVKSLMVLKTYLGNNTISAPKILQIPSKPKPATNIPLSFQDGGLKLGRFDNAINDKSDCGVMTFEYEMDSLSLGCRVKVSWEFTADDDDPMNNGWLKSVKITNCDDEVVYQTIVKDKKAEVPVLKLSWFKQRFIKAGLISYSASTRESKEADDCIGVDPSLDITENSIQFHKDLLTNLEELIKEKVEESEKELFLQWFKSHDDELVSTKYSRQFLLTAYYGVLNSETEFISNLCELTIEEAAERISNLPLEKYFESHKVEMVKKYIIDSLQSSDVKYFKDWFSSQEDQYLDRHYQLSIQPMNFMQASLMEVNLFDSTNESCVDTPTQSNENDIDFCDVLTFFCLADDDARELIMENPIDMPHFHYKDYISTFYSYVSDTVLPELLVPEFIQGMHYLGSAQVSVQRLYSNLSGNNSFSDLLLDYFNAKRNYTGKYVCDTFLNKWIKEFGLGYSLTLKNTKEGTGLLALLHEKPGDEGRLLADEGYGITQLLSILLNVEKAILTAKTHDSWEDSDYMSKYLRKDKGKTIYLPQTIAIEEPENHLHPKLQSILADMFLDAYTNYNIHFIVETHSEYLIRKTQLLVSKLEYSTNEEAEEKCPFRTYYLQKDEQPYSLGYRKDGKFVNEFGEGFYDEAASLMFQML